MKFDEVIGQGSYGTVHKGIWRGETVALKRLPVPSGMSTQHVLQHNKELAALRYEFVHLHDWICSELSISHMFRLLKHPNLVSLLGYSASADEIVLIMNFVSGSNLDTMLFGGTIHKV